MEEFLQVITSGLSYFSFKPGKDIWNCYFVAPCLVRLCSVSSVWVLDFSSHILHLAFFLSKKSNFIDFYFVILCYCIYKDIINAEILARMKRPSTTYSHRTLAQTSRWPSHERKDSPTT